MTRLAFYGGSFNPPTTAHEAIVRYLVRDPFFQRVLLKPCGFRRDKPELRHDMDRREAVMHHFSSIEGLLLDTSGMQEPMVPTIREWEGLKSDGSEVWLVAGTDLFEDMGDGRCQIQTWVEGQTLFEQALFMIFPRPISGEVVWPPHHRQASDFAPIDISSTELRKKRQNG